MLFRSLGTPQNAVWSPSITMHSNPHTQSLENSNPTPRSEVSELEAELSVENTPLDVSVEKDGGDISEKMKPEK